MKWPFSEVSPIGLIVGMLSLMIRHAFSFALITALLCGLWIVVYLVLLLIALIFNLDTGGRLTLPVGLLMIVFLCFALCCFVFGPAAAVCELLGRRYKWPWTIQWLVGSFVLVPLICGAFILIALWTLDVLIPPDLALGLLIFLAAAFTPYWMLTQFFPFVAFVAKWLTRRLCRTFDEEGGGVVAPPPLD